MPILPHYTQFVIVQCWSVILYLVGLYWYEQQLSRYQGHWLVTLHQQLDLSRLEQACAGFQANNGRGAPILHPPPRLVRALLVKYLHDLSLRQTEELIDSHILIMLNPLLSSKPYSINMLQTSIPQSHWGLRN